jgi:SHS2 domain-containing protein
MAKDGRRPKNEGPRTTMTAPDRDATAGGYVYLEDVATADIAFRATHLSLAGLFIAAADATMNVMVDELDSIQPVVLRQVALENESLEMLLHDFLQEIIYYKDADQLLLRVHDVTVDNVARGYVLRADAEGETLNRDRHRTRIDVKAVTLHDFSLTHSDAGWQAQVTLDV